MPAFARCCLCIAANLLVFTNPMASPITITSFLQAKQHREMYNRIEIAVGGGNRRQMSIID